MTTFSNNKIHFIKVWAYVCKVWVYIFTCDMRYEILYNLLWFFINLLVGKTFKVKLELMVNFTIYSLYEIIFVE